MVILVSYHLLCGLYHGLCLPPELDLLFQRQFCQKMSQKHASNNDIYLNPTNVNINNNNTGGSGFVQANFDDFLDVLKDVFERQAHSNLKDERGNEHKTKGKSKRTRKNGGMGHSQSQQLKTLKMERHNKPKNENIPNTETVADDSKSDVMGNNGNGKMNTASTSDNSTDSNGNTNNNNNNNNSNSDNVDSNKKNVTMSTTSDKDDNNNNDENNDDAASLKRKSNSHSRSVSPNGDSNSDDNGDLDFESTQLTGNIDIEPPDVKKEHDEEERNALIGMVKIMAENYATKDVSQTDPKTKNNAFASAGDDFYEHMNNRSLLALETQENENENTNETARLMEFNPDLAPPSSNMHGSANGTTNGTVNGTVNENANTNTNTNTISNTNTNDKRDNEEKILNSTDNVLNANQTPESSKEV